MSAISNVNMGIILVYCWIFKTYVSWKNQATLKAPHNLNKQRFTKKNSSSNGKKTYLK